VLGLMAGLGVSALIVFVGVVIATLAAMRGQDSKHYVAPFWTYPTHLLIIALGAAAGGATTARITEGRSAYSVFLLALILLMSALVPVMRHAPLAPGQPAWFTLAVAIANPLAALVGGLLTRRAVARHASARAS
jgi:hypothetical protein